MGYLFMEGKKKFLAIPIRVFVEREKKEKSQIIK